MKANFKKTLFIMVIVGSILTGCFLWLTSRPIEIIAVHEEGGFSAILVNNFPLTENKK